VKYAFPATYGEDCILVPIDAALVPMVAGALIHFQQRGYWKTDADYEQGYNAFAELQADMSGRCIADLIESNNRIYRLLDTSLNGETYTSAPNPADPTRPLVTPDIPAAPASGEPTDLPSAALRSRMERLINLVDNLTTGATPSLDLSDDQGLRDTIRALQGVVDPNWFGFGKQATLADLVAAMRRTATGQQDSIKSVLDQLKEPVEPGIGDVSSIINTVSTLFGTAEEGLADGSQLLMSTVGTIGTVAMLGALGVHMQQQRYILADIRTALQDKSQIDRLIASLDGGGDTPPGDNVLLALRGITEADDVRNVIDAFAANTTMLNDTLSTIVDNTGAISTSTATIDANISAIADNTFNTAGNTGAIAASTTTIDGNISSIVDNTLATADNTGAIAGTTATIDGNIAAIATTLSNMDNNVFNIATNTLNTADNTGAMIGRLDTALADTALLVSLLTDVRTLLA